MTRISDITVFHGFGMTPDKMWFPWIHRELEDRGYAVRVPAMPNPLRPDYRQWHKMGAPIARRWGPRSLVIGHSIGGAFAVRLLEREARARIAGLILVGSPFTATLNVKPYVRFFAQPIDWSKVRDASAQFGVLHAKDDPLVPYDQAFRYGEALGAPITVIGGGGHFVGKTCPPLLKLLRRDFGLVRRA